MILDRHGQEAAYFFFIDIASLIFSSTDNCERLFLWNIIDIREYYCPLKLFDNTKN